jgi:hypothetical protein
VPWKVTAAVSFAMVRTIVSQPALRIKGNDLAMRVSVATIGPRRDSRPNDRPPRKDARPRQHARPRPYRHPQKIVVSEIRMSDLPVIIPWPRIFSKPVIGILTW